MFSTPTHHAIPLALPRVVRRRRLLSSLLLPLAALSLVPAFPACTSHTPAGSWADRLTDTLSAIPAPPQADLLPIPLPPGAWPPRKTDGLTDLVASTPPGLMRWAELDGSLPESELDSRARALLRSPIAQIAYVGVHGVGVIREINAPLPARPQTSADAPEPVTPATRAPDQPITLRFVSSSLLPDRPTDRRSRWWARSMSASLRSPPPGLKLADRKALAMLWDGTSITIIPPDSAAAADHPHAGLILHMSGLNSLKYEQPVLDALRARGWSILRVTTPSLWWLQDSRFDIPNASAIQPTAARIARIVDDLIAEPAFAAEAALNYLDTIHPDLRSRPLVLLGMSAGALMMPTVAARLGERVDAMVLVGGGANLLDISQRSELTDGGLKLSISSTLDRRKTIASLNDEYLAASHLDPYHTAAACRDVPTLLVLAGMDTIVPAHSGRLLWERLGRPERYTFSLGHALLFWSLDGQARRITTWIDRVAHQSSPSP